MGSFNRTLPFLVELNIHSNRVVAVIISTDLSIRVSLFLRCCHQISGTNVRRRHVEPFAKSVVKFSDSQN